MLRLFLTGIALLSCVAVAQGDIVWEKEIQEFHVTPEDKAVEAKFVFKNTGPDTINIRKVQSSCGCTTTRLSKMTFAPGEIGEVEAKFTFGGRRGAHQKVITLTSDDKREWRAALQCWIHEPLTISPMLVYWKVGDEGLPRSVTLNAAKGGQVRVKSVKSSSPRFSASVQPVKEGDRYTVTVKPIDTSAKESAEVIVETDYPRAAPRSYRFFARIK